MRTEKPIQIRTIVCVESLALEVSDFRRARPGPPLRRVESGYIRLLVSEIPMGKKKPVVLLT